LCLEKLIKSHFVKDNNSNVPPKVHNLVFLVKQTKLKLSDEQMNFLTIINDFQLQGRYPDYKFKIKQLLTKDYVNILVPQIEEIRKCLLDLIT
jgi:HEPN domain-containing protein